jgi:hypothetical protein
MTLLVTKKEIDALEIQLIIISSKVNFKNQPTKMNKGVRRM